MHIELEEEADNRAIRGIVSCRRISYPYFIPVFHTRFYGNSGFSTVLFVRYQGSTRVLNPP
jgi:hypothetical protein